MRRLLPLVVSALAACTYAKHGLNDDDPDGGSPFDADPNAPDALIVDTGPVPDMDPGAPDACVPECLNSGTIFDCGTLSPQPCPLGCETTGGAHCGVLVPSNDPDATTHVSGATANVVVPYTFDTSIYAWSIFTDTGEIRDETGVQVRAPGVGYIGGIGYHQVDTFGVFSMNSLVIEDDAQLWGFGESALIILVDGTVDIHGVIDVSAGICPNGADANRSCPGPGGGFGAGGLVSPAPLDHASGCAPGGNGNDGGGDRTGGGGGGFGGGLEGWGGAGGNGDGTFGGLGGLPLALCAGETLVPLMGGSGAGWGGGGTGGRGGGGGGAVQISSYTSIEFSRISSGSLVGIWAGGAGGGGGLDDMGGGGGGAGGGILLEAPTVTIDGNSWFAANGGGAGGGNGGVSGELGDLSDVPAPGGMGGEQGGFTADGGDGGAIGSIPGTGQATDDKKGTGGGGGGVGRVRINAGTHTGGTTTSSPAATFGTPDSI